MPAFAPVEKVVEVEVAATAPVTEEEGLVAMTVAGAVPICDKALDAATGVGTEVEEVSAAPVVISIWGIVVDAAVVVGIKVGIFELIEAAIGVLAMIVALEVSLEI